MRTKPLQSASSRQKAPGIYVEIRLNASLESLIAHTQTPELHQAWDLRFTTIQYLPRLPDDVLQQFLYTTKIGFGLAISGHGESTASHNIEEGNYTSALRFWSNHQLSLIETGTGYWNYQPENSHINFSTWFDYKVRFGVIGRIFDRIVFRPIFGYITALSFDCLRVWLEDNEHPQITIRRTVAYRTSQIVLAISLALLLLYPSIFPSAAVSLSMIMLLRLRTKTILSAANCHRKRRQK